MKTNSNSSAVQDHSTNLPRRSQTQAGPVIHKSINPLSDAQTFERLARLSPAEYDRSRKAEARRLRVRIETLDAEVASRKTELNDDARPGAEHLPPIIPWPEPVDGKEALSQTSERFSLYIVLPPG